MRNLEFKIENFGWFPSLSLIMESGAWFPYTATGLMSSKASLTIWVKAVSLNATLIVVVPQEKHFMR